MRSLDLTEKNFDSTVDKGIVVVDFWASWCGPCKAFAPVFEAAALRHEDVVFAKVDTEAEPGLARTYQIRAIPSLMVLRDGIIITTYAGAMRASELDEFIQNAKGLDMEEVRRQLAEEEEFEFPPEE